MGRIARQQPMEGSTQPTPDELYRALFEQAADGIVIADTQGRFVEVNPQACEMLGYTREELLNLSWQDLIPVEDLVSDPLHLEEMRAGKTALNERRLRCKDGQLLAVEIKGRMLSNGRLLAFVRDISERKQAEAVLRESEERYRGLFEHMLEGFAYCKIVFEHGQAQDFIYLAVNDMFETLTGLKEVTGKRVSEVIPGIRETDPELFDIYARVSLTGKPEKFEMFVEALKMWFSVSVYSPEKEFFVAMFDVITERKHTEEAMRLSMERLRLALDAANSGTWEWDLRTNENIWSEELWKVYGLEPHSCVPSYEAWRQVVHPDDRSMAEQVVQAAARQGTELNCEFRVLDRDGTERWLMSRGRPLRDADGRVVRFIGIALDITQRKWAEEAVRESEEQYHLLFDEMLSGFALHEIVCDEDGVPNDYRFLAVNAAFEKMTGLRAKDIIGKTARQVLPGLEPYWIERYGQVALTGASTQFEDHSGDLNKYFEVRAYCPKRGQFAVVFHDITQRRRAETEMQKLAKFPDENPNPVLRVAPDGVVLYANQASAGLLESWNCAVGRQLPDGWRTLVLAALDSGLLGKTETVWGDRVFSLDLAPILEGGYVNIYGRDITQRKQAEDRLRAEEERFRLVAQSLSDVVYEWDLGNRVQWFGNVDELLGYAASEFPRTLDAWLEVLHPEDRERVWSAVQRQLRGKAAYNIEYRVRHRDGDWRYWQSRGQVLRDASGQPQRWIGAVTDITEQKRAEESLRQSRERERFLADIIEKADQPFAVGYPDGRLGTCNRAFCELTGYSAQELQNLDWSTVLTPPEWIEPEMKALAELDRTGSPVRYQKEYVRKDGRRVPIELLAHVARDEGGSVQHYYAFVTDITERKRAEEEIRQLNAELEQRVVERTAQLQAANQELEAFAYSVSHDLRAPLRAVDGFTRILQEDYGPLLDAEGQRVCGVVRGEARRMGQLIDDLLDFSRLGRARMQVAPIDMERLAASVFDELTTPQDREHVELHVGPLPPAQGDLTLMRQAWQNLLANAVKFSSKRERAVVEVGGRQDGDENLYWVRDNGAGFDMQYADKLFGVFQRLHSEREFDGTGVGLAIVRRVIHRHGGRVWAESEVDRGATFYFALPRKGG